MPMTLQEFPDVADPRFRELRSGMLKELDDRRSRYYTIKSSDLETERGSSLTPMPSLQNFTSSGRIQYKRPYQGYDWQTTPVEWALGLEIQRRLIRHDLFDEIEDQWRALIDSTNKTQQEHAAAWFNEGDSSSVFSALNFTHSRGEALFANTHASTFPDITMYSDNLLTMPLTRTQISTARVMARKWTDDSGDRRGMSLDTLVIPPDLEPAAEIITRSEREPGGDLNDTNIERGTTVDMWDRITDVNDWALVNRSMLKKNLCIFMLDEPEYNRVLDFDTFIAKYSAYTYYSQAWKDWRVGVKSVVS